MNYFSYLFNKSFLNCKLSKKRCVVVFFQFRSANTRVKCTTKENKFIQMKIHALSAYAIQIGLESTAQVADNMTVCWREIQESSSKAAFLSIMKKLAVPLITTAVSIGIIFNNKIFFRM